MCPHVSLKDHLLVIESLYYSERYALHFLSTSLKESTHCCLLIKMNISCYHVLLLHLFLFIAVIV